MRENAAAPELAHCAFITYHASRITLRLLIRRFNNVADDGQELFSYRAVDDAMVVAQGQQADLANGYRIVDDDRPLLDAADTEDCHLRLIDDRQSHQAAEDAGIRDRERAALHFVGLELLVAGAGAAIGWCGRQGGRPLLVRT